MKGERPRIVVVGSLVMDLVFRAHRRPGPGETFLGSEFGMFLGGKGFNQAVGARRLGADVTIVGRVGDDYFGRLFQEKLRAEGIAGFVRYDPEAGTGVASPVIDEHGQNSIIGVPRANMRVAAEDAAAAAAEIERADVLMLQFEIPTAASARAAEIARRYGTLVLLDPAPVCHGGRGRGVEGSRVQVETDYIVPNEVEAHMLTGRTTPEEAAAVLLPEVRQAVVISLGERGAFAVDRARMFESGAFPVEVVDTTGAGDAFRAGLAVMLAEGRDLKTSVRFANACGALACTVMGAEPSMPARHAVEAFLVARPKSPSGDGSYDADAESPSGDGSYGK